MYYIVSMGYVQLTKDDNIVIIITNKWKYEMEEVQCLKKFLWR